MATQTKVVHTTCPMDCPDTCALEVTVAAGRIEKIAGAHDNSLTNGFICSKVAQFSRRVYHEDRLLHPLRRTGPKGEGRFERIPWDEAIATIAARFREIRDRWGAEAILPYHYGGSNGFLNDGLLDDYFFARLGASRGRHANVGVRRLSPFSRRAIIGWRTGMSWRRFSIRSPNSSGRRGRRSTTFRNGCCRGRKSTTRWTF